MNHLKIIYFLFRNLSYRFQMLLCISLHVKDLHQSFLFTYVNEEDRINCRFHSELILRQKQFKSPILQQSHELLANVIRCLSKQQTGHVHGCCYLFHSTMENQLYTSEVTVQVHTEFVDVYYVSNKAYGKLILYADIID